MYSIYDYGVMINDSIRMNAYWQALRRVIGNRDCVVADIGTGTGIFALLACQLGARQVYAIESNHAIQLAREIATANGYSNRIQFIQHVSTRVALPESVDIIISDLHGALPLFDNHIPTIIDARRRYLKLDGILIPQKDSLWMTIVEAPELYVNYSRPWSENPYGLNMKMGRVKVTNNWRKARVKPEQFLTQPYCWKLLDYTTIDSPHVRAEITSTVTHAGTGHGLSLWFDTVLAEGITFSNAPSQPELIYGNAFFPWAEPVVLAVGDTITVTIQAKLIGSDYMWSWDTRVLSRGQPVLSKAQFKQSTFLGMALSPDALRKQTADYLPALNEDGQIARFVLERMNAATSLRAITHELLEQFPTRFPDDYNALTYVTKLSQQYSQ